jgi:hypothetical protein
VCCGQTVNCEMQRKKESVAVGGMKQFPGDNGVRSDSQGQKRN